MSTRKELVEAVGQRYRATDRAARAAILEEFVALTGYHRKWSVIRRHKARRRWVQ